MSARLQKFSKVKPTLYNFRCPYCGDSKKHKNKARGYLYQRKQDFNYKCHNCGMSRSFTNFLKDMDKELHSKYLLERYREGLTGKGSVAPEPKFTFKQPKFEKKVKINLPKATESKVASDYLRGRKLDPDKFYYAEKFKEFCNSLKKTFNDTTRDHGRIIIPFYDSDGKLLGFQGRSLSPYQTPKYLTIMLNDSYPKVYGLDKIRRDATVFITEGPFDSTLIRNSIAMCGADGNPRDWGISDAVWVYDNEPRNEEIVSRISKLISSKQKVVIWPNNIRQKDINDMILSGLNVQSMIESNTYSGLEAELQLNYWKRNEHNGQKKKRNYRTT